MVNLNARHDPEDLTKWGRAAAMLYISKAEPLSQAVFRVVKDKELTTEHIKRILEVANITAYLAEYERMEGPSRVVNFPEGPATLKKVLGLTGESPGEDAMHSKDYEEAPLDFRVAKAVRDSSGLEKAAAEQVMISTLDDVAVGTSAPVSLDSIYYKLNGAVGRTENDLMKLSSLRHDLQQRIFGMFKEAIRDGNSLGDVRMVSNASGNRALDGMLSKVANEMSQFFTQADVDASMTKVSSHRIVNVDHPMRKTCDAYRMVCADQHTKTAALEILKAQRGKVLEAMKRS